MGTTTSSTLDRGLVGGMIGAAVAATVWLGLEHITRMDLGWLSCAVGIVTGDCVHRAAGPNSGGSFVRGILSIILTLVAIVGGRQVFVKVMEANASLVSTKTIVAPVLSEPEAIVRQEDTSGNNDETLPQTANEARSILPGARTVGSSQVSLKSSFSEWAMLWMGLAALAAYILGKGRDEDLNAVASDEPQSEPQPTSEDGQ
ncbi:MAG: hypothetical protein ABGX16_08655 [Pirellulales bacterium]